MTPLVGLFGQVVLEVKLLNFCGKSGKKPSKTGFLTSKIGPKTGFLGLKSKSVISQTNLKI